MGYGVCVRGMGGWRRFVNIRMESGVYYGTLFGFLVYFFMRV